MSDKGSMKDSVRTSKGGQPSPPEASKEARIRYLLNRMRWSSKARNGLIGVAIASLLGAAVLHFGVYKPALKEYTHLTQDRVRVHDGVSMYHSPRPVVEMPKDLQDKWATLDDLQRIVGYEQWYEAVGKKLEAQALAAGRSTKFIGPNFGMVRMTGYIVEMVHRDKHGKVIARYGPFHNTIVSVGQNSIVDAFQGLFTLSNFRHLGFGESSQAVVTSDTGCVSELSTAYTDDTRVTGAQGEGTSANIYEVSGVLTADEEATIEEFCLLDQNATGGGNLFARALTGTVALSTSETLTLTYRATFSN